MTSSPGVVTFLFTDIEGSTRLWEDDATWMQSALARHDAIARDVVRQYRGVLVKMTGDGVHAAFDDPLDAVMAALALQSVFALGAGELALPLQVRCGIHAGIGERRDGDFYGPAINRAARIMAAAHGGQVLVSQTVAGLIAGRLALPATLRDLGSVRLRDLASAENIHQLLHPSLRAEFPPLRSLEATPNNLPQQLTSFIGRERELAEVTALVGRARLVTLTGPGGIGKTRLSLQAAADVMDRFPDGVHLVELAPVSDPRMVAQAVATPIGVKEEAGHSIVDALASHVRDRSMLLILDNCEHLVQSCAELATTLLRAGSGLHIIASSREALRVAGESSYPVPSLSLARDGAGEAGAPNAQSEAVKLFVERATAARPAFRPGADNLSSISAICGRLDGIPLAIELAAACTRTMSVARIEQRLSDRFRLLATGDRAALPRQQTLRALIDWSYDLLTPTEQALLRALSVFAGGFTMEAAAAVASGGALDPAADVDELVRRLVEKSLVAHDLDSDRCGLLETVRQYAQDRLREAHEEAHVRDRHLGYQVEFANRAQPKFFGAECARWLAMLDAERENVVLALAHCDYARGGADASMQIAVATKFYWFNRGLLELGYRICNEALGRSTEPSALRVRALLAAGQFASWRGHYDVAFEHLEQGLAIARDAGESELTATILQPLGIAALGLGNRRAARDYLEEALALARQGGDKHGLAAALNQVAMVERIDGRTARAAEHYAQALVLARELEDSAIVAVTLLNLAMVAIIRASPAEAPGLLLEALRIGEASGDRPAVQGVLDVCTALASMSGDSIIAARFHGMAKRQLEEVGMQRDPVDTAFLMPWIERARQDLGTAAFAAASGAGRDMDYARVVVDAKKWLDTLMP